MRRKSQRMQEISGELSLIGEIVHGQHGGWPELVLIGEVRHGEGGLPIVGMDDVRTIARDVAYSDPHSCPCERAEAKCVVGPVAAIGPRIGIAGAVEEMRRVEHEKVET